MSRSTVIIKTIAILQLLLLVFGIVILLLDDASHALVWVAIAPFVVISAVMLLGLIVSLVERRQYKHVIWIVVANLLLLAAGCVSIFFTSRFYVDYMSQWQSDTISYELIPARVILPDSAMLGRVYVVHDTQFRRRHLFSNEYEQVNDDSWNDHNNGWYNYYSLIIEQGNVQEPVEDSDMTAPDITRTKLELIGVPRNRVVWIGVTRTACCFDYRDGKIPADTIRLKIPLPSGLSDTVMVVKRP